MSWSRRFDEPVAMPDGSALATLRDAGSYITALPAATQKRPAWQAAAEALLVVVTHAGDPMLARIALMRALHESHPPSPSAPRRKPAKVYRLIR